MPTINFQVQGEGFPVILIHGFCLNHEMWSSTVDSLSNHFKVYAIDLPGFGKSQLDEHPISLESIARSVVEWTEQVKIERAIFIGHSLGGYIALAIAESRPALVYGLGLVHSTAFADSEENRVNRDRTLDFIYKHGHKKWINAFVPSLFANEKQPYCLSDIDRIKSIGKNTPLKTIEAYTLAMRDRKDRFEIWEAITGECLLIGGTEDIRISQGVSEEHIYAREKVSGHILSGIGHMAMFEDSGQFNQLLKDYLTKSTI